MAMFKQTMDESSMTGLVSSEKESLHHLSSHNHPYSTGIPLCLPICDPMKQLHSYDMLERVFDELDDRRRDLSFSPLLLLLVFISTQVVGILPMSTLLMVILHIIH